jgi:cyclin B
MKFKLVPSTLYLCVTLLDQYCTANHVQRNKLQLVGVTALLVACKYEEIYPPEVRDCVYITDHAYTREEVLETEMKLLLFFGYNVSCPTSYQFLTRFLRIGDFSLTSRTAHRASYFSERCLQEHEMLSYRPSLLAAAAVYLASSMESDVTWVRPLLVSVHPSFAHLLIDICSDPRTSGVQWVHGGANSSMCAPNVRAREQACHNPIEKAVARRKEEVRITKISGCGRGESSYPLKLFGAQSRPAGMKALVYPRSFKLSSLAES